MLIGQERLDDLHQLNDYTTTQEIEISVLRIQRRKLRTKEYDALAEAIGNNYAQLVWRLLAQGLRLSDCIPIRGRSTNPLVMSLYKSPYMELAADIRYPNVLKTLLLAPPKPHWPKLRFATIKQQWSC